MSITVWTMCTGDKYPAEYVQRLASMVKRNLTIPYRFVCITDKANDTEFRRVQSMLGVEYMQPPTDYQGWWGKLGLFKQGIAHGQNLWLDLDVVITGSLDTHVEEYGDKYLAMPWNWAKSGHGGCQSSVMLWYGPAVHSIYNSFDPANAHWPPRNDGGKLWGDQEWITVCRDNGFPVTQIDESYVKSYKYHCKQEKAPPSNARVIVFHGKPDPHECSEEWIKEAWA